MQFTAEQIAAALGGEVVGNPAAAVHTFAKIEEGVPGAISFLANPKYEHFLYETKSAVVLVNRDFQPSGDVPCTLVRVDNAYESIARLLTIYQQHTARRNGHHPTAVIEPDATVGEDCYLGPHVYIGHGAIVGSGCQIYANCVVEEGAQVGDNCTFYPGVSVYHHCRIGSRVILHSGCVIGADGFGFAPTPEGYEKIPQIGIVEVEDDVEIGANTCVDRSTMGQTRIRRGVKLDNLVQIGHNCEIGAHTVMSAQVGVAGSTKVGEWCMMGGQVGVAGHARIADRTLVGAQAGIAGSVKRSGTTIQGSPAIDAKQFMRAAVAFKSLPEMQQQLHELVKKSEGK